MSYPVPENEAERLKALTSYAILDTPPEEAFDDLNRMAAQVCGCPVAVINLIAELREWYKAHCGLPPGVGDEPRGGICSTAICGSDLLVVPDLTLDKRFAGLPYVAGEPYFRFYAGMPLINPQGYALGSLCVLDHAPREISFDQSDVLRCLARQVVAQLELRRGLFELNQAQRALAAEKERSDDLLRNILPAPIADELKAGDGVEPRYYDSATIMFTDFKDFTRFAETTEPRTLVDELNHFFSAFDDIINRHDLEKLKTIGDAYMCAGGLPEKNRSHSVDACLAALEIQDFMGRVNRQRTQMRLAPWELRIGIHTGPVMAGVVGKSKFSYDIWGDAVNVAALMEANGDAGRITLSESVHHRIKSLFVTEHRGTIEAKNKGRLETHCLIRLRPEFSRDAQGRVPISALPSAL